MTSKRLKRTKVGRTIPVYYYGKRFESMRALGNHLNLTVNQIKWALTDLHKEELMEQEVSHLIEGHCIGQKCYLVFDQSFHSFGQMAEALGIKENILQMIYFRNKERGLFEEEVLKRMKTEPITYKNVEYESLAVLCSRHSIDYPTFIRRIRAEKKSIEEALMTPIIATKGHKKVFRGKDYLNIRELYNAFGYARSLDCRFKSLFPKVDSIHVFDLYLKFLEEHGINQSEDMLTTIPMVYYEGTHYNRATTFYEEMGVTMRNVGHEKNAKENKGLTLETIVLNMATRINQHNGSRLFPNCRINPHGKLLFVKRQFEEHMKKQCTLSH